MTEHPVVIARRKGDDSPTWASVTRDRAWFRAEYYAWCARKSTPLGRMDPATGKPYSIMDDDARRIGRIAYIAAARVAYAQARRHALPLP